MGLSVTEKEHIKELVEKRINREIERITTANKAAADDIKNKAKSQAIAALGVGSLISELEAIKDQLTELAEQKTAVENRLVDALSLEKVRNGYGYQSADDRINTKIANASLAYEQELLFAHPELGKIVTLRNERDNLLQNIWIATSNAQVKQLFEMVNKLLGTAPTDFEQMTQQIPPDQTT